MTRYSKAIAAVVAAVLIAAQPLFGHGWDRAAWLSVALAAVGAVGVWLVPELPAPDRPLAKTTVAIVSAAGTAAVQLTGPLTAQGLTTIVLAALGAAGVTFVSNAPDRPPAPTPPAAPPANPAGPGDGPAAPSAPPAV